MTPLNELDLSSHLIDKLGESAKAAEQALKELEQEEASIKDRKAFYQNVISSYQKAIGQKSLFRQDRKPHGHAVRQIDAIMQDGDWRTIPMIKAMLEERFQEKYANSSVRFRLQRGIEMGVYEKSNNSWRYIGGKS